VAILVDICAKEERTSSTETGRHALSPLVATFANRSVGMRRRSVPLHRAIVNALLQWQTWLVIACVVEFAIIFWGHAVVLPEHDIVIGLSRVLCLF
jgi:hypothetical protein